MPTAVAIKRANPDWQLDWVVQKEMAGLLRDHRAIDSLIEISRRPQRAELRSIKDRLRQKKYDVALDMQGLFKSGRIVGMSGAKRKLGYHWQRELSWLFSAAVRPTPGLHVVEQYLAVAEKLGCPAKPVDFGLTPSTSALEAAESKLSELRLEGRPLAMNLGAGKPEKKWPLARFAEFVYLAREDGWAPFVIGGPGDVGAYAEFRGTCSAPPPSLAGQTSLEELIAVLSLSDAHVGGDTGSTHIAVALGKPVGCMMGPTKPERSGPYGQVEHVVYRGEKGLGDITATDVLGALTKSEASIARSDSV